VVRGINYCDKKSIGAHGMITMGMEPERIAVSKHLDKDKILEESKLITEEEMASLTPEELLALEESMKNNHALSDLMRSIAPEWFGYEEEAKRLLQEVAADSSLKDLGFKPASSAIRIGQILIKAKKEIARGPWGKLRNSIGVSERTGQNYMLLAEAADKNPELGTMSFPRLIYRLDYLAVLRSRGKNQRKHWSSGSHRSLR